jgi:RNA polymerase sigma-70 factor (ECF subfamily)
MSLPSPDELSDVAILRCLAEGDGHAIALLYDRYASILLPLAIRIVRDHAEAEDIVHDAFVVVGDRASQYAPERGTVVAWLVTLVRNLSIDRARRRDRRGTLIRRALVEQPIENAPNPEELAAGAALRSKVRRALESLPEVQRATLEIAFFEGLSYPEISAREGVPLGTIKSRVARALMSLREALGKEGILGVGLSPGDEPPKEGQ